MSLMKKIFLGAIACIVVVTAIGMLNPSPQEVVKEAFAKHEIDSLSKKYNSADEKVKADYHQLYRQAMLKGFEECVNFDRENKFNYDGEKRWQNLNKMAQFALNINDKSFESDKKLAKNINECTKLRKEYSDGCLELYKKYKVSETSQISVIRRYIVNELTNAKGVYYACGYEEIFGNYIPKDDFNECVLDFSNANFTSLRRGVNRLNVVYDGKEKLEKIEFEKTHLQNKVNELNSSANALASELSKARKKALPKLEAKLNEYLEKMYLPALFLELKESTMSELGLDKVEVNLGAVNLKNISSGELNRLRLAFIATSAELGGSRNSRIPSTAKNQTGVLILDEIDANLSGKEAMSIASVLEMLGRSYQIFAISHQPQLSSKAAHHFLVEKKRRNFKRKRA